MYVRIMYNKEHIVYALCMHVQWLEYMFAYRLSPMKQKTPQDEFESTVIGTVSLMFSFWLLITIMM